MRSPDRATDNPMTYERTLETEIEVTVTVRKRETERVTAEHDEEDPHPSFPPLRVVVVDSEPVNEEAPRPLAKCAAIPFRSRKAVGA
jgi:hypothetical protein